MKNIFFIIVLLLAFSIKAQQNKVGINTDHPEVTLDIVAIDATGINTNTEGLLVPRIDRLEAQNMTNPTTSSLVYINDISTGTASGKTQYVNEIGFYYFNAGFWYKVNKPSNSSSTDTTIYNINGSLSGNRIITQGDKTLKFTTNSANGFSIDEATFSVDGLNHRVGVNISSPTNPLHVNGKLRIQDGSQANGYILTSSGTGVTTWKPATETKQIMVLKNTSDQTLLDGDPAGSAQNLTNFSQVANTIKTTPTPAKFTNNGTQNYVDLYTGTYEISVSFELTTNGGFCPSQNFLQNSYFIELPAGAEMVRVHSNSDSICGANSVHSAIWNFTVTIPTYNRWNIQLGRGVGGNAQGQSVSLKTQSRILIKKIG